MKLKPAPTPVITGPSSGGSVSLRPVFGTGPKGDTGDQGETGPQGEQGPAGYNATGAAEDLETLTDYVNETAGPNDFASALKASFDATLLVNRTQTMNLRKVVTPSGSNDTAAVNTALAAFAAAGGGKVVIPRDNWLFTGSTGLTLSSSAAPLHLEFEDGAAWDMTGLSSSIGFLIGGSAGSSAALGADAAKGAETITCSLSVAAGDTIQISSTDYFETLSSQPKGEFQEVLSVAAGVITLKGGLFDSYTAATTTVTKLNLPRVTMEGEASFLRNSSQQGVQVAYARDVMLGGLYGEGARERLFYLNHVFGATVDNVKGRDFWYSGTGTSYGLVAAATQHLREIGLDLRGGRHAVSHGGFVPCRDIQVIGGTFDNYHASGQKSFDFHGDCEDVRIVGAEILNGLTSQASNMYVGGGTRIRGVAATPAVEIGPARSCDFIKFNDVDVESATGQDGIVYYPRNGPNATTLGLLDIKGTVRAGGTALRITPSGSTHTGATISRLAVRGELTSAGSNAAVTIGKATAAYVGIGEALFDGRFYAPGANAMTLAGTSTGRAEFRGTYQTDTTLVRPIDCEMFGDVDVRGAVLRGTTGTPFRSFFTNSGVLNLDDVVIDGAFTNSFDARTGPTEVIQRNVRLKNGAGVPLYPARHHSGYNEGGKVVTTRTAAPTTGVWNQGDAWEQSATAAAGVPGGFNTVTGGASSAAWVLTTAYAAGLWIRSTTGGRVWEVTTAGTSGATEPATFASAAVGDTATDGTVTWTCRATTQAVWKNRAAVAA